MCPLNTGQHKKRLGRVGPDWFTGQMVGFDSNRNTEIRIERPAAVTSVEEAVENIK